MNKISDRINQLPAQDKKLLDSLIQIKSYKKGQIVFDEASRDHSVYYVAEGLLRKFVLKEGVEKTLDFYFTDNLYFPAILEKNRTTNCFLQALENSTVFKLDNFEFEEAKKSNLELLKLENLILELAFEQTNERLQDFQTLNATERYQNLIARNPGIVRSISLTHIASYLGINNASLSKIRSRLR